ncbi:MAG: hypothetical protein ACOX2D_05540 [Fermentimonas sp.]|jgi:hypothetical protein
MEIINLITHINKIGMKIILLFVSIFLMLGCKSGDIKDLDENTNIPDEEDEVIIPKIEVDNPYKNVNWEKAIQIRSTSHVHITDQAALDRAARIGYRHLPISNYYPSAPYYPIDSIKDGQFRVKQDFGVVKIVNGQPQYIEGPIYWNDIIMDKETGWYNSLTVLQQRELPFKVGDFIFKRIPKNMIFSPNAEHHAFANVSGSVHINSLGSLFSSGTFDARNNFKTFWGGGEYSYGAGLTWQETFEKMLDQLLFKDGGGITINHPTWTNTVNGKVELPQSLVEEMLDFDPRVLGIEVYCFTDWDLEMWDNILKTGRRCLGFFVPDWGVQINDFKGGFNILLMDDFTEHNCLKSYRDGAFFGSQFGSEDLIFKRISLENEQLIIEVNSKSNFTIITDKETSKIDNVTYVRHKISYDIFNIPTIKYIRVEVENGKERIFSQPIRFIKTN